MQRKLIVTALLILSISLLLGMKDDCGRECPQHKVINPENHQQGMKFGKEDHPQMDMLHDLELSDAQRENIEKFNIEHKKNMIRLNSEIDIKEIDLHESLRNHDFSKARKLTEEISDLRQEKAVSRIDKTEMIWKQLTEEQRQQLENCKMMGKQQHKKE